MPSGIEILRNQSSLAFVAGMKTKQMTTQNRQKSNAKTKKAVTVLCRSHIQTCADVFLLSYVQVQMLSFNETLRTFFVTISKLKTLFMLMLNV